MKQIRETYIFRLKVIRRWHAAESHQLLGRSHVAIAIHARHCQYAIVLDIESKKVVRGQIATVNDSVTWRRYRCGLTVFAVTSPVKLPPRAREG